MKLTIALCLCFVFSVSAFPFPSVLPKFELPKFELPKLPLPEIQSSLAPGRCPTPVTQKGGFNASEYLGTWYEIKRTGLIFEFGQQCVTANYSLDASGNVVVNNTGKFIGEIDISTIGTGRITKTPGVLAVSFFPLQPAASYWVVETDYTNYALVLSCNDVAGLFNIKDAWILARKPSLDSAIISSLEEKLNTLGVQSSLLKSTPQYCY